MGWKLVELFAEIGAEDSKYKAAIAGVRSSTDSAAATIRNLQTTALGVFSAIAGSAALRYLLSNFAEQEAADRKLAVSLEQLGKGGEAAMFQMRAFASEMQNVTTVGDETILAVAALGANIGKLSGETLQAAVKAAIGLSRALDMDLHTAMMLVSRAAVGQTSMLSRYGIVLNETATDQEKFNELLEIGAKKFSLATAEAQTTIGQWEQLKNTVSDFAEVGGEFIATIGNKVFAATKLMGEGLREMKDAMEEVIGGTTAWEKATQTLPKTADQLKEQIEATVKAINGGDANNSRSALVNHLEMLLGLSDKLLAEKPVTLPKLGFANDDQPPLTDDQKKDAEKLADQREKDMKRIADAEFAADQTFRDDIEQRKAEVKKEADDRIAEIERVEAADVEAEDRKIIAILKIRRAMHRQIADIDNEARDNRIARDMEAAMRSADEEAAEAKQAEADRDSISGRITSNRERLKSLRDIEEAPRTGSAIDLIRNLQQVVGDRNAEQIQKLENQIKLGERQLSKLGDIQSAIEKQGNRPQAVFS